MAVEQISKRRSPKCETVLYAIFKDPSLIFCTWAGNQVPKDLTKPEALAEGWVQCEGTWLPVTLKTEEMDLILIQDFH